MDRSWMAESRGSYLRTQRDAARGMRMGAPVSMVTLGWAHSLLTGGKLRTYLSTRLIFTAWHPIGTKGVMNLLICHLGVGNKLIDLNAAHMHDTKKSMEMINQLKKACMQRLNRGEQTTRLNLWRWLLIRLIITRRTMDARRAGGRLCSLCTQSVQVCWFHAHHGVHLGWDLERTSTYSWCGETGELQTVRSGVSWC